jgi:hypothetical protein
MDGTPNQHEIVLSSNTSSSSPRNVPLAIRRMILELGMRYRPGVSAGPSDLEAHDAKLALLAADLADAPPKLLTRAIGEWVRTKAFLPKASELLNLIEGQVKQSAGTPTASTRVEGLRMAIPRWNQNLYRERPDLNPMGPHEHRDKPKAEWRVNDDGQAYVHDLTLSEIAQRREEHLFS